MNTRQTPDPYSPNHFYPDETPTSQPGAPLGPVWTRVLLAPVMMMVATLSPVLVSVLLGLLPGAAAYLNDPAHRAVAYPVAIVIRVIPALVGLLLVWLVITRLDRRRLREAGVVWTARSLPCLLLGIGISCVLVIGAASVLQGHLRGVEELDSPRWWGITSALVAGFVMQAFPEELIFRGYLLQALRHRPVGAVVVSAVVFGLLHLVSNGGQQGVLERFEYIAMPTGFAFAAGALVLLTKSLWSAVGIHGGLHLANLVATLLGLSVEGPAMWLGCGALFVAVGLGALGLWRRGERRA